MPLQSPVIDNLTDLDSSSSSSFDNMHVDPENRLVTSEELPNSIERVRDTLFYVRKHPYRSGLRYVFDAVPKRLDKHILALCVQLHLLGLQDRLSAIDDVLDLKDLDEKEQARSFMQKILEISLVLDDQEVARKQRRIQLIKKSLNRWARKHEISLKVEYEERVGAYKVRDINFDFEQEQEKARRRKKKKLLLRVANVISLVVGLGEGLVAMALGGLPMIAGLFLIGIPAWLVNYYLFKGSAFTTLKQLAFDRLYEKENGEMLPDNQRWKIKATLFSSFTAASCFGFLSFGSGLHAFGSLFFGLSVAASVGAPPIGLIMLAAFVAIVTTIALTTLFYCSVADFIKNDRFLQIKQYFKEIYVDKLWNNIHNQSRAQRILEASINVLFLSVFVAGAVVLTLSTFGLFIDKTVMVMSSTLKVAHKVSHTIALLANFSALPINLYFGSRSILIGMNLMKDLGQIILHPKESLKKVSNFFNERKSAPVAWIVKVCQKSKLLGLLSCVIGNSYGQAQGGAAPGAVDTVTKVVPISKEMATITGIYAQGLSSAAINAHECFSVTSLPSCIRQDKLAKDEDRQKKVDRLSASERVQKTVPIPIPTDGLSLPASIGAPSRSTPQDIPIGRNMGNDSPLPRSLFDRKQNSLEAIIKRGAFGLSPSPHQ